MTINLRGGPSNAGAGLWKQTKAKGAEPEPALETLSPGMGPPTKGGGSREVQTPVQTCQPSHLFLYLSWRLCPTTSGKVMVSMSSLFGHRVTSRVQAILCRGTGAMGLTGAANRHLVLLLSCADPGLVRDKDPLPWSWALCCSEVDGLGKLWTDIVRYLGRRVLLWDRLHFRLW